MRFLLRRFVPQPLVGALTLSAALVLLYLVWHSTPYKPTGIADAPTLILAFILTVAVILAHGFPIHIRPETRVYMCSIPLYLIAVLLPPALAIAAVAVGKLGGEFVVRGQTGGYLSDSASQVGRWIFVAYAGTLVAHLSGGSLSFPTLASVSAAVVLLLGDIVTSPLVLSPITGQPPRQIILAVAHDAGPAEAAQYLIGMLGALASMQASWSLLLLFLPTILVYTAFKSAKDMHESARFLMASVVDTSTDAILLLDIHGSIISANRQAAAFYGYSTVDEMTGISLVETTAEGDRTHVPSDMTEVFQVGGINGIERSILRQDGSVIVAELNYSMIRDKQGHPKAITCVARDITERKRAKEALEYRALHDALTNLPNRVLFGDRLQQAVARTAREGGSFAVCLMDLNGFKGINDTYGHHFGDAILVHVANRLQKTLRDSDTVARLGGDEFALILPKAEMDGAAIAAERIVDAITVPYVIEGRRLDIGTSIGITIFREHGESSEVLLQRADAAMYAIKRAGGGYIFYEREHDLAGTQKHPPR